MTRVYDAVHQFIELEDWEFELTKSPAMQRLRAIFQISTASFAYSGAQHMRFDHSIGTMHVGTMIFDHVVDLAKDLEGVPQKGSPEYMYWRRVVRAACLLHDTGHTPTAHLCEHYLLGGESHEAWTKRIIMSKFVAPILEAEGINPEHVAKVAVGQYYFETPFTAWESLVCEMLTGDNYGADRIDYLIRDSYFTGLAYGAFDYPKLIQSLRIIVHDGKFALGVVENGLEACMALLMARYFMYKRLYQYSGVKSYSYHYANFAKKYFEGRTFTSSVDEFLKTNDFELFAELYRIISDPTHPSYDEVKPLIDPKERYIAFAVSKHELHALKESFASYEDKIIFEEDAEREKRSELSFPVLRKNGMITPAQKMTEFNLPERWSNWVMVCPSLEDVFWKKRDHVQQDTIGD